MIDSKNLNVTKLKKNPKILNCYTSVLKKNNNHNHSEGFLDDIFWILTQPNLCTSANYLLSFKRPGRILESVSISSCRLNHDLFHPSWPPEAMLQALDISWLCMCRLGYYDNKVTGDSLMTLEVVYIPVWSEAQLLQNCFVRTCGFWVTGKALAAIQDT